MTLAALQQNFQAWLTDGTGEAAGRFPEDALPGLAVYQNNYRSSLVACLEETFPQTRAWVGEESFLAMAAEMIDAHPPTSWSIDHHATHFPAALAAICPDDPELADLAALELALADAFVGPDADPLGVTDLSDMDWDSVILQRVPTARLIPLSTNAAAIFSALSAGTEPPSADVLSEPATLLVWRQAHVSCFRMLDPPEAAVIATLAQPRAFAAICQDLGDTRSGEEAAALAGAWLGRWVVDGMVQRVVPIDRRT